MLKLQFRQQNMIPVLLSHHLSAPARRQLFGTVDIKVENIDINVYHYRYLCRYYGGMAVVQ